MAELSCQIEKLLEPNEPTLTVGERFLLKCGGEKTALDPSTAELRLEAADKYKLKLLRLDSSGSELRLEVLSDQVGKHELKAVQVVDANQSVVLQNLNFEVRSVQDPQSPVQEPYGSIGPLHLSVPWYYWMVLVMVLSVIGIAITWRVLQRLERRRLMREILAQASGQQPEGELFQKIRKIQREADFLITPEVLVPAETSSRVVAELNSAYRFFLSRAYEIPFASWNTSRALRVWRREYPQLSEKNKKFVTSTLRELDRSMQAELRSRDIAQIIQWIGESAGLVVKEGGRR